MAVNIEKLKNMFPPPGMDFHISKVGHVVLQVANLERATEFYTSVLGFKVSDVYPDNMMSGGMVFLRCATDHHCLALVSAGDGKNSNRELHHLAFEVPTLGEVLRARDRSRQCGVKIDFEGRRRAGCQIARVPRPGQSFAGNLLGRRSGRQRWPRAAVKRMARCEVA